MYQKPSVQQEKSSSMSPEIAKIYRIFMGSTLYTSDTDNTLQKKSSLSLIILDFSITTASIIVWQTTLFYTNSRTPYEVTPTSNPNYTLASLVMIICLLSCATSVYVIMLFMSVKSSKKWYAKWFGYPKTITLGQVLAMRICFEYAMVTSFIASIPHTLGEHFVQSTYLTSSSVLLLAIGRDLELYFKKTESHSYLKTLCVNAVAGIMSFTLANIGIWPMIKESDSFPSTPLVTTFITIGTTISLLCAGSKSLGKPFPTETEVQKEQ